MLPAKQDKKKNHLKEITILRQRISELETLENDLKRAEEKASHINAVLYASRRVHQLIASDNDIEKLLKGVCKNLIETRGYYNAWIALLDQSGNLIISAEAGLGNDFKPMIKQLKCGGLPECGRRALAQSDVVVTKDPLATCKDCILSKAYYGREAMSARLEHGGRTYGLLAISIPAEYTNNDEERSLFKEIADDISFALYSLEHAEEHRRVIESLEDSERRYRDLFNSASDALLIRDLEGNILEVNRAVSDITGYTEMELTEMNISQFLTPESVDITIERQQRQLKGEVASQRYELELIRKDGMRTIIDVMISIIHKSGQPVAIQANIRDVTEQKRVKENMRFYIAEITKAQEEERKRIARELHDETAQDLATLLLDFDSIIESKERLPEATLHSIDKLRERAESIMEGVRRFSRELRPAILDQLGLLPALEWLADDMNVSYGIDANVKVNGTKRRFSPDVELVLFRIAQEAFRNVQKHSRASKMETVVEFSEGKTRMAIYDNGKGLDVGGNLKELPRTGKLGLAGMEERVRLLGGKLRIQSEPGKGTSITVEAPI